MGQTNEFISKEILDEYHLTPEEFLVLVTVYYGVQYKAVLDKLIKSNYIKINGFIPTINNEEIIKIIENKFDRKQFGLYDKKELMTLAADLRKEYPSGNKMRGISWRSSDYEIFMRLKRLQEKTGNIIDHDLAVEAVRQYVESFKDDNTYMQVLKYFIFKNEVKDGQYEFKSELLANMDIIASGGTVEKQENDWISELR